MEVGAINLLLGGKKFTAWKILALSLCPIRDNEIKRWQKWSFWQLWSKLSWFPLCQNLWTHIELYSQEELQGQIFTGTYLVSPCRTLIGSSALLVRKHFSLILWLECQSSWFRMNPPISDQILIQCSWPTSYVFFITLSSLLSCLLAKALWSEIWCWVPILSCVSIC